MTPRQYKPFTNRYKGISQIVYPVKDESPLQDVFENCEDITAHLDELYGKFDIESSKGDYHILFVWNLDGNRMTDVWIHDMKNWSDSGPLIECITFRNLEICHDAGIASGDSIIVLGHEEELRRSSKDIAEYVDRSKCAPEFPSGIAPDELFEGSKC